jgi:ribosome modulation factor
VPETEVKLRAARVPASLKRGLRDTNPDRVLKSLAEWLAGWRLEHNGTLREGELVGILGSAHAWRSVLGMSPDRFLMDAKTVDAGRDMQREMPLTSDDVIFLTEGPRDPIDLAQELIERKQPRWLMGWRGATSDGSRSRNAPPPGRRLSGEDILIFTLLLA